MKPFLKPLVIAVFLLFCLNGIRAQTNQPKFNQAELFKQFVGIWKGEMGKDTTFIMEMKSFYDAFECCLKTETNGKIVIEEKTVMVMTKKRQTY